ncbi:MAG: hypothetical protein P0116_03455 [Candidatus Nitrosocosmicus sp.]|nr:hypothetical protein [Candidatus Nitrosocosmicus sp.]
MISFSTIYAKFTPSYGQISLVPDNSLIAQTTDCITSMMTSALIGINSDCTDNLDKTNSTAPDKAPDSTTSVSSSDKAPDSTTSVSSSDKAPDSTTSVSSSDKALIVPLLYLLQTKPLIIPLLYLPPLVAIHTI